MKSRLENQDSTFDLFPKEIWQLIFQLSNINLRDLPAILTTSVALSQFVTELVTVVYKKHFPHLYQRLPEAKRKNISPTDLNTAYRSDYRNFDQLVRRVFTYTKDGELEKIQSLPWRESALKWQDMSGFSIVDWARKKGHSAILNYFYSKYIFPTNLSEQLLVQESLFYQKKLNLAIYCLQPLAEINAIIQLIESHSEINFSKICLRAAKAGHIELFKTLLSKEEEYIENMLYRVLDAAAVGGHIEIIKLVLPIVSRKQKENAEQFALDMGNPVNYALRAENKDILIFLLNKFPEFPVILDNLFDVFTTGVPELVLYLLEHPRFQLTDPHFDQIKRYLRSHKTIFDMSLLLLGMQNVILGAEELNDVLRIAFESKYPLEEYIKILIKKNIDLITIKNAVYLCFLPRSSSILDFRILEIPGIINHDIFDFLKILQIIDSMHKENKVDQAVLQDLSVTKSNQVMLVTSLYVVARDFHGTYFLKELMNALHDLGYTNDAEFRNTMFHLAARKGLEHVVKGIALMPSHDVNSLNADGETALMTAVQAGNFDVVIALYTIEGLNVDLRSHGRTAQDLAYPYDRRNIFLWMELQKIRKRYEHPEDSLLAMFTVFNIGRRLGAFLGYQVCEAIDALALYTAGKIRLGSIAKHEDILLGTERVRDIYIELKNKKVTSFFAGPKPLPQ